MVGRQKICLYPRVPISNKQLVFPPIMEDIPNKEHTERLPRPKIVEVCELMFPS